MVISGAIDDSQEAKKGNPLPLKNLRTKGLDPDSSAQSKGFLVRFRLLRAVICGMHIENAHQRLRFLWGRIDRQHNELIAARLTGKRVLGVGCGYRSLVAYLSERGYAAEGVDYDSESIDIAKQVFPHASVRRTNAEDLADYPDHSFDSIILKDCMHHFR